MNKQVRKYVLNILFLVLLTAGALYFVLRDHAAEVFETLKQSNILYVLLCIACVMGAYVLDSLILLILTRLYNREYRFKQSFFNDMIGRFFSGITPSSSGGQFAQAYTFSKQGVPLTSAASILMMMFIAYEFTLNLFGGFTLLYTTAANSVPSGYIDLWGFHLNVIALSVIGFAISFLFLGILLLLAFNKRIHHKAVDFVVRAGVFFHIVKKDKARDKKIALNARVETFRMEMKRLLSNTKILFSVIGIYIVRLFVYHSASYFAFRACRIPLNFTDYLDTVAYSSFTYMITQLLPIPGGSGGAEYVFSLMFSRFTSGGGPLMNSVILVWRFSTFYFGLFFGVLTFIFYRESPKLQTLHYSDRTLLEIEVIHLNDEYRVMEEKPQEKAPLVDIDHVESYFESIRTELEETLEANAKALDKEERKRKRKKK